MRWSRYAGGDLNSAVVGVTTWDMDGAGPLQPVIGGIGNLTSAGSIPLSRVGLLDEGGWRPAGAGVSGTPDCVISFDFDGSGPQTPRLVAGGGFSASGTMPLSRIGAFDGTQWFPISGGVTATGSPTVYHLGRHNNWLLAAGNFASIGGVSVPGLAYWDQAGWHAFPDARATGPDSLLSAFGSLYVGGRWQITQNPLLLTGIYRWSGTQWETVGTGFPQDHVDAMAVYQGQLIAGGEFTNACCGNQPAPGEHIARFNGATWEPLGLGLNGPVLALCTFDPDGPGPLPELLIAGGSFLMAGGGPASYIAAWDGTQWRAMGGGTTGTVRSMTVWKGRLVVAGQFFEAGGIVSPGLAFWSCPSAVPCYANCDASTLMPTLNVADFVCFMNRFAAIDPGANCDSSTTPPALNVADFICYVNAFAAGCI